MKNTKVFIDVIDKLAPYTFSIFYSKIFEENQYGTYTSIKDTNWKVVIRESYSLILESLNEIILNDNNNFNFCIQQFFF